MAVDVEVSALLFCSIRPATYPNSHLALQDGGVKSWSIIFVASPILFVHHYLPPLQILADQNHTTLAEARRNRPRPRRVSERIHHRGGEAVRCRQGLHELQQHA